MPDFSPAPLPGTIAYAEWKRRQEQAQKPVNQETGKEGSKEGGRETFQEVSSEGRKEASPEASQEARNEAGQTSREPLEEKPVFKASFLYTEQEIEFFEDLKLEMRRRHGLKVTKNDLARAGIRLLTEDYRKNQDKSFLVKASRSKPRA